MQLCIFQQYDRMAQTSISSNRRHWFMFIIINFVSLCSAIRRYPNPERTDFDIQHPETDSINYEHAPTTSQEMLSDILRQHHNRILSFTNENDEDRLPKPDDHLVTDLPYLSKPSFPTKHYAGHLPASPDDDKKLFYWLFEPNTNSGYGHPTIDESKIPLVIWLNGGPGCSSMDGLFLENGPFRLTKPSTSAIDDWKIDINPYSWHNAPAYVMYIDQPVGTGLSFTKKKKFCRNDLEVNIDFSYFLQSFFHVYQDFFLAKDTVTPHGFPQRILNRPFYFSGESHAGHYIPSMIDFILKQNDESNPDKAPIIQVPVSGAAIGNGWIDPFFQYAATDFAVGAGMIGVGEAAHYRKMEKSCQNNLINGNYNSRVCFDLLDDIVAESGGTGSAYKVSTYDDRLWEPRNSAREFPIGHKDVERFLGGWNRGKYTSSMSVNYESVLKAIHADESISAGQKYQECTDPPYNALAKWDGLGVRSEVVRILEHQSQVHLLFFNGMNDIICNHFGNEKLLEELPWKHKDDWIESQRYAWYASDADKRDRPSGWMKRYETLSLLKIKDSGHMVPMDLPVVALDMLKTFIYGQSFEDKRQSLSADLPDSKCSPCPTCPEVITQGKDASNSPNEVQKENPEDIINKEGSEDAAENSNMSRRFMFTYLIMGTWIGAIAGLSGFVFISRFYRGRLNIWTGRTLLSNYDDSYDLELRQTHSSGEVGSSNLVDHIK